MYPESKKRFTLKIVLSYSVLGILTLLSMFLIYQEFENNPSNQNQDLSNKKLLKTNELLTQIYEAENLSKFALQTKKTEDLESYTQKVDSINQLIDSLKTLTEINQGDQPSELDSVQQLLNEKVLNNTELIKLKVQNEKNASFNSVLDALHDMEVGMGRITPETFVPNFSQLPAKSQKSIKEYVAFLNQNIPEADSESNANNIDSILEVSKAILNKAKAETAFSQRSILQKELQIYRNDLELSQQVRSLLVNFEDEMTQNSYLDDVQKAKSLKKTSQFAWGAVVLGLITIILFTVLISKDYWKVQQYREQLEKAKKYSEALLKSREQLISTVSHDLRTPLNTISGYSDLIAHTRLNQKQTNYLNKIKSSSDYVENLVNDLLDFSKLEAGKIHIEMVPFLLHQLIMETVGQFEEIKKNKNVSLQLNLSNELNRPIISDPFRIRQILTNLIGNAFKFTDEGQIKITTQIKKIRGTSLLQIKVEDTGVGIPTEMQETIFQEFTQAKTPHKKAQGGYGLGLTISKKLTELLKGTLRMQSEEGKGSSFTLEIPFTFSDKELVENNTKDPIAFPAKTSLLVIDDDEDLLGLISEVCKQNHVATQCHSSYNAIDPSQLKKYDAVLTDIQMPQIDGFEVLKSLRKSGYTQPIIAMTGQQITNKSEYLAAGFSDVLQKPFTPNGLLTAIAVKDQKPVQTEIPGTNSDMFTIEHISAFLNDFEAVQHVLLAFLDNNNQNIDFLFASVGDSNFHNLRSTAHKMLPMFKQLEVPKVIPVLEYLETISDSVSGERVYKILVELRKVLNQLDTEIREYVATNPIGNG